MRGGGSSLEEYILVKDSDTNKQNRSKPGGDKCCGEKKKKGGEKLNTGTKVMD